jgi:hypothetical protein
VTGTIAHSKVFLSWHGTVSHALARALYDWIPNVVQTVRPFLSSSDLETGARWSDDLARELEGTHFGVLCITRESVSAPWLNYEAGALSKSIEKARVVPLLFDMRFSEVKGPLVAFNMALADRAGIKSLIDALNNAAVFVLDDARLNDAFERCWPELEQRLNAIRELPEAEPAQPAPDANGEMLEELLELTRSQQKLLQELTRNHQDLLASPVTDIDELQIAYLLESWDALQNIDIEPDVKLRSELNSVIETMKAPMAYFQSFFDARQRRRVGLEPQRVGFFQRMTAKQIRAVSHLGAAWLTSYGEGLENNGGEEGLREQHYAARLGAMCDTVQALYDRNERFRLQHALQEESGFQIPHPGPSIGPA